MSRTYRLRHEKSRVAKKFADGHFTLHMMLVDSEKYSAIIHGMYNVPCELDKNKPAVTYSKDKHTLRLDYELNNHSSCKDSFMKNGHVYYIFKQQLERMSELPRYQIAPTSFHEYAYPGSKYYRVGYYGLPDEGADRRKFSMKMRKVLVTGDDRYL